MILTHVRLRDITGRLQKRTAHSVIEDNDKPTSQASRQDSQPYCLTAKLANVATC